ncbi:BnaC02g33730D [Brassica napus]|uniref:BnaC02g33730D protein n=1 Tax=Brassica napus TaxID=3708 RepID=A0A078HG70_BRANA|nr:BnaC02g33730D [Brassica napus]
MDSTSSFNRETDNMDDAGNIQTPDSTSGKRKETEESSGATNNVKCILPTRYKVWEHYTRMKEDRNNHLAWSDGQEDKQPTIDDEGKLTKAKLTEAQLREATNQMIVLGQLPLSFVESVAWRHFCNKVNFGYTPHSRRTETKVIIKMYVERKEHSRNGLSSSPDSEMRSKASDMLKKFEKYWDDMKNINMMLIVATVFDPSNKLELAKMCFEELYGLETTEYKEMHDSLICVLRSLFREYSSRHGAALDPKCGDTIVPEED